MGGSAGPIEQMMGNKAAPAATAQTVAGYTPAVQQATYQPQFSPAVQQAAQQQVANQQQMNPYFSQSSPGYTPQQQGLQQLLGNMMSRYQQPQGAPQQAAPQQQAMPQYGKFNTPASPLSYRPTMQPAQQSLGRVAKSVVLQQKEAAEAESARLRSELEAAQAAQQPSYDYYYGGGG